MHTCFFYPVQGSQRENIPNQIDNYYFMIHMYSCPFVLQQFHNVAAYVATRSESHGSWFNRVLVATY